jgi:hypothetical protein
LLNDLGDAGLLGLIALLQGLEEQSLDLVLELPTTSLTPNRPAAPLLLKAGPPPQSAEQFGCIFGQYAFEGLKSGI